MKKYFILHPAVFKLDGGAMFGIIPKPLWSKFIPADELNRIQLSLRVMLIQTSHKNILIDSGIGDYHGKKFDDRFGVIGPVNPLIEALRKGPGLTADQITDVIMTHLHFDHAGGLGQKEDLVHREIFPNATLHIHRLHYDYSLNPTLRDAGSFESQYFNPLIQQAEKYGRVHWLDGEEGIILKDGKYELLFRCSHGHTPWLVHPLDSQFIYMADLVPTSAHIPIPWVMGYDISPGITTINKQNFYEFIIENQLTMIFEHDMNIWGAKIKKKSPTEFEIIREYAVSSLDPERLELMFD
jgi:glyoxylase-like metal-dependent hydrolase (beta-lactamase superfamily II)